MTLQLDDVTHGKSPSRPITARCMHSLKSDSATDRGVASGMFRGGPNYNRPRTLKK